MLLIKPTVEEAMAAVELLRFFGASSCLFYNMANSSVSPILCEGIDLYPLLDALGFPIQKFPIHYPVLRLSLTRFS
jgi:hypothetical protein